VTATFGEHFRAAREKRGLSLRQMAKVLVTDHAFLHRIETGEKHTTLKQAADWARYLGEERAPWVQAVLQDMLRRERIALTVEVRS
jgi:ribosome-binding protein aMBF1 (putative translation factor)